MRKIVWLLVVVLLLGAGAYILFPPGSPRQPARPLHEEVEPATNAYLGFLRASLSPDVPVLADPTHPTPADARALEKAARPLQEMLAASRLPESQRYDKLPLLDPNQPNYAYPTEKKLVRAALGRAATLQGKDPQQAQALRLAAYTLATRLAEEHAPFGAAIASADLRAQVRQEWALHPPSPDLYPKLLALESGLPAPADFLVWEVGAAQRGLLQARQGNPLESCPGLDARAQEGVVTLLDQQLQFLPAFQALDEKQAHEVQAGFRYRKSGPSEYLAFSQLSLAIPNYERLLAILKADRRDGWLLVGRLAGRAYARRTGKAATSAAQALAPGQPPSGPLEMKLEGGTVTVAGTTVKL